MAVRCGKINNKNMVKLSYGELIVFMIASAGVVLGAFYLANIFLGFFMVSPSEVFSKGSKDKSNASAENLKLEKEIEMKLNVMLELDHDSVAYKDCWKNVNELIDQLEERKRQ